VGGGGRNYLQKTLSWPIFVILGLFQAKWVYPLKSGRFLRKFDKKMVKSQNNKRLFTFSNCNVSNERPLVLHRFPIATILLSFSTATHLDRHKFIT